jgi:hypothetical protein
LDGKALLGEASKDEHGKGKGRQPSWLSSS